MKKFNVYVPEIHVSVREIVAENEADARLRVSRGEGMEVDGWYQITAMSEENWEVGLCPESWEYDRNGIALGAPLGY